MWHGQRCDDRQFPVGSGESRNCKRVFPADFLSDLHGLSSRALRLKSSSSAAFPKRQESKKASRSTTTNSIRRQREMLESTNLATP
jgi:tRNA U34 5-methylaminomethyl-2-thiouridine-forming methyltransferase MnmC